MFKNKKNNSKGLKKMARIHAVLSSLLFLAYLFFSFIYSPEFLFSDLRSKFNVLANNTITILASVLGPPVKPEVSGSAVCDKGHLYILLNWADDKNSVTYDIERNTLPLVSGLTNSSYRDNNVEVGNNYSYIVTAYGPMDPGNAVSDLVMIETPEKCEIPQPIPEIKVVAFDGKSVNSYEGVPETIKRRPSFSGTTNISNSEISLVISGSFVIVSKITANDNGYWSWTPPVDIAIGTHILSLIAKDPFNPERFATSDFLFDIIKKDEKKLSTKKKTTPSFYEQEKTIVPIKEKFSEIPLDFSLSLINNFIYQGGEINSIIRVERLDSRYENTEVVVRYLIFSKNGEKKTSVLKNATLKSGEVIKEKINIPGYWPNGEYYLRVEIIFDRFNISREKKFYVLTLPVINLGGGLKITYAELLSQIGKISLIFLLLLLLWIFLFFREYWLQLRALRHITEHNLRKLGFFGAKKRKGESN